MSYIYTIAPVYKFCKKNMKKQLEIYFLGSGPIAIPILKAIVAAPELRLLGIGTQADRPSGRSRKPASTPLGTVAMGMGLAVDKVANVNDPAYLAYLHNLNPAIVLVVSFGQILRDGLLELPRIACVNIHASLLPRYRGASPVVQCILNRDSETGICFTKMERGLDTGGIYSMIRVPLDHRETCAMLEAKLGMLAGKAVPGTLCSIALGDLKPVPQDDDQVVVCTKIKKIDGKINWSKSAEDIEAMVRAYHPWPGAFCKMLSTRGEIQVTLTKVICRRDLSGIPGRVLQADKYALIIACGEGALEVLELAPPGKREMAAVAFLNGLRGEKPVILP